MSERMPTGIGTMEARTDAMLDLSREQNRLAEAIEARATSPEVSLLNDSAALEIFGSGDRTYTNPETGAVVASPEKPILGKLDDIRKNPKYGKTQADRDASAEEYQSDLENLLDDGLELCQAKMIMDMRESDVEARATRTAKLIAGGSTAAEADAKAREEYEKKDATRVRLIKEGGAFTAEDYEQVRKGNELYPATPVEGAAEEESAEAEEKKEPEKGPELEPELQEALNKARKNLAALSAEMRRRTAPRKGLKEEYSKALSDYDAVYQEAGHRAVKLLRDAGIEEKDIRALVVQGVISEKLAFDREQQEYVSSTSDKYWNRQLGKFTAYWARSGVAKRMIIGGAVGAGATIVTAGALTTAGVGGLMAGAAALSTRVARSLMFSKVGKDAALVNGYEQKKQEDLKAVRSYISEVALNRSDTELSNSATLLVSESVDRRVQRDQHENRRRLATSLIGIAAGSGVGLIVDNVVNSPLEGNGGKAGARPEGGQTEFTSTSSTSTTQPGGGSTSTTVAGSRPEAGGAGGEVLTHEIVVHIDPGEGTSHIARDTLGINFNTLDEWNRFNDATNPLFANMDGTYFDSESGEWRIQNPGSFKVPQSVLDEMQRVAQQIKTR